MDEPGLAQPATLLDREDELGRGRAALRAAARRAGAALVLKGGASVGKSRFLKEARNPAAEQAVAVLGAWATELEREFPFEVHGSRVQDADA